MLVFKLFLTVPKNSDRVTSPSKGTAQGSASGIFEGLRPTAGTAMLHLPATLAPRLSADTHVQAEHLPSMTTTKMSLFGGPIAVSAPNSGRTSPVDADHATTTETARPPRDRSSTVTSQQQPHLQSSAPSNRNASLLRSASMFYTSSASHSSDTTPGTPSPFHLFNLAPATRPVFDAMGITTPTTTQYVRRDCVEISPQGDMDLEVTSSMGMTRFSVDSHVLCLASPVFRAMLGPHFKEGNDLRHAEEIAERYTLPLLDDDSIEAFEIILNAIHLQNAKVSEVLRYDTLLDLAVIIEKYQMYQAITPWIGRWTQESKARALEPGFEGWLFIAWALRDDRIFTQLSEKLIKSSVKRYDGLLTKEGRIFDKNLPQAVLNEIAQRRDDAVLGLLKICHFYYNKYTNWSLPSGSLCGHPDGHLCDTLMLGALMKSFGPVGLLPGDAERSAAKSVDELMDIVKTLEPRIYECVRTKPCAPASSGLRGPRCNKHGDIRMCPGPLFHETCNFLPGLTIEVDHLVRGVHGLELNEFRSRTIT